MASNITVDASVLESGKNTKTRLTIFKDEYAFSGKRVKVNWGDTVLDTGVVTIKSFLFSSEKPYIIFKSSAGNSSQFVFEQENYDKVLETINQYQEDIAKQKQIEEDRIKAENEEKQRQVAEREKIEAEKRKQLEIEKAKREKELQQKNAEKSKIINERNERIAKEVEKSKNSTEANIPIDEKVEKAVDRLLNNPYRLLGISCTSTIEDANKALDKLKKLSRLNALSSYTSDFDLKRLEKPSRELSIVQNAVTLLKNIENKWFWFAENDACQVWYSGKYRIELNRDGQEFGSYDLFLANYLYGLICDSNFDTPETWKRILKYFCYICNEYDGTIIKSRFNDNEIQRYDNEFLLKSFKKEIFIPLLELCDSRNVLQLLSLYAIINDCGSKHLNTLSRNVLEKITNWFSEKEEKVLSVLAEVEELKVISAEKGNEIFEIGNEYCKTVGGVITKVLSALKYEKVRYDIVKESYRITTYQLMYELNKCVDKTNAIYFANITYSYCSEDDRQRICNTFGIANIKVNDPLIAHTGWDIWGDNYFYGKNGYEQDYAQALYWYHKAADEGNMYSMNSLGICYLNGCGVPQSDELAANWFEKAYENDNPEGAYNLAECYYSGKGRKQSIDKALEYWTKADKLGHPSAGKKKDEIFATVKSTRKTHRANNHICHDIGFQMPTGSPICVEVELSSSAFVYLVNAQNYQNYFNGDDFRYYGGFANETPYAIDIPSSGHWYVIIDNGDETLSVENTSTKIKSTGY